MSFPVASVRTVPVDLRGGLAALALALALSAAGTANGAVQDAPPTEPDIESARAAYEASRFAAHRRMHRQGSAPTTPTSPAAHPEWAVGTEARRELGHRPTANALAIEETNQVSSPRPADLKHHVTFLPAAPGACAFVRVVNRDARSGEVSIVAIDDAGQQFGPVQLAIRSLEAVHVDVDDLQYGNAAKGLAQGVGLPTEGDWRLELASSLDIRAAAFSCSVDGLLASLNGRVAKRDGVRKLALFTVATGSGAGSLLRLVNPGDEAATATIRGVDDDGAASAGEVRATIPPRGAKTLHADDLRSGGGALDGALGDGSGNWRLAVSANRPIHVAHLQPVPSGLENASSELAWRHAGGQRLHRIPYFPPESSAGVGVVRFVNDSNAAGTVEVRAFDQTARQFAAVRLSVAARQAVQFDAAELANRLDGDGGEGAWRLELATTLNGRAGAYFRNADGQLANLNPAVTEPAAEPREHRVSMLFFDGADSPRRSRLRLVNWDGEDADVTVTARDDRGVRADVARIQVPARSARTYDAWQLETGDGPGLGAGLGDGAGSWRFDIASTVPLQVLNLLETNGQLANLSHSPTPEDASAAGIFAEHVSEIVQSRCVRCHVAGGRAAGARLRFTPASASADHQSLNIEALKTFLADVPDAAALLLNRVQGIGHGGGVQLAADTEDFVHMARLLTQLGEEPVATPSTSGLFDGVRLEAPRRTLRRAALIFAGRIPTAAEYAALDGGGTEALRRAVRGLMAGEGFHEFLLRASNDRLLTDRELARFSVIDNDGYFVRYDNEFVRLKQTDEREAYDWHRRVQYGAARAPLELIAHVVENDLPYTTVLTADYVMANPEAAWVYGADTAFDDPGNVHEFKPSEIVDYYRHGLGHRREYLPGIGVRVVDAGPLITDHPHAGVLNTKAFLQRYPTTATNRNRARARWTYLHFLGVDVEKSASRTTDPVALADTDNPTLKNPACTVCHQALDPVAGAFQNYGDSGYYRDQWGGLDALDEFYKNAADSAQAVRGESAENPSTLAWELPLAAGRHTVGFTYSNDFYDDETGDDGVVFLDTMRVLDEDGLEVAHHEFESAPPVAPWGACGEPGTAPQTRGYLQLWNGGHQCAVHLELAVENAGLHAVEVVAWGRPHPGYGGEGLPKLSVVSDPYRLGDTWYRDMRSPGFPGEVLPDSDSSLAWLARRIVADDRFAVATVKFWWPSVMGREVAEPPADAADADSAGRLLAANAQRAEVQRLARGMRAGFAGGAPYNVKDLLTELALGAWFRARSADGLDDVQETALADAGAARLLTPEELSRKAAALTGVEWGRWRHPARKPHRQRTAALTDDEGYRLLYGGIDSDGITTRARDMTSVMAGVAKAHAAQMSCPVVLRELYLLPDGQRRLFAGITPAVSPRFELGARFEAGAARAEHTLRGHLTRGAKTVFLKFPNDHYTPSGDRNLFLDRLDVRDANGEIVQTVELESLAATGDCNGPQDEHYALFCRGWLEVPIAVETTGEHELRVVAWADLHGDEAPLLEVVVEAATTTAIGERAVKRKLVELHNTLLGVALDIDDEDIADAYGLFTEVWQRKRGGEPWFMDRACHWEQDIHFLDGLLADPVGQRESEHGPYHHWNRPRAEAYLDSLDLSDPHFAARAWVAVLAHLMMDYRYLHL